MTREMNAHDPWAPALGGQGAWASAHPGNYLGEHCPP